MNTIIGKLGKSSKFKDLVNKIEEKNGPIAISGLTGVGSLQLLSGINEFTKKPILILTYNEIQAKRMLEDIKYFSDKVTFFPKKEVVTYADTKPLEEDFGFRPSTPLRLGLRKFTEWYKEFYM